MLHPEVENLDRIAPRYLPRVTLYRRPRALHGPLYRFWMLGDLERQTATPPGRESGCRWLKLDDGKTDYDGMPGAPSNHAPYALTCDFGIAWLPTATRGKFGWILEPSGEEEAWRDLDRAHFQNEVADLQDEIAKKAAARQKHDDEDEQLESALGILEQLAAGASGYFKTAYQALHTGTSGIFYGLQAPNVPMRCTSAFVLAGDRAVSIRLQRAKAPTGQARHEWRLFLYNDVGAASTCYALVIGEDGNASEFWHFRNMARGKREKLLKQMRTVEDRGRLTVADHKQLLDWEAEEQGIRAGAKNRTEGAKDLTEDESARITELQQKARDLKDSKHLSTADEDELRDLKEKLFLQQATFKLQEEANDLIGREVDITLQWLQAGFVSVASGKGEWIYENTRLTGANPPRFASGLPDGCRMSIESDGGQWSLAYGHPKYVPLLLLSQPFESEVDFDPSQVEWNFSGAVGPSALIHLELAPLRPPRTSPHGIVRPGLWQLRVEMKTDGRYTPELYWIEAIVPPGPLGEAELVWDSQNPGNPLAHSGNWIQDVVIQSERGRGPHATIHVVGEGVSTLPLLLGGLACDIVFRDQQEAREVPMMRSGKVVVNPLSRALALSEEEGRLVCDLDVGAQVAFEAVGLDQFLTGECTVPLVLNGALPNEAMRDLCRYAALEPPLYAGIPAGDIGIAAIPGEQPGRYPALKIAPGTRWLEAIQHIVKQYCPGWELIVDDSGLRLIEHAERDKTQRTYGLPPQVDARSKYCLRREWSLVQDTSDVTTGVTVLGAKNPQTGMRCHASDEIPQMFRRGFEDSMFWIGEERHETASPDDGLGSDDDCARAARERLHITPLTPDGLAPWTANIELDLDPELREGDVIPIFGMKFLVDSKGFGSLAAERDAQKMHLSCILTEDVRVALQVLGEVP